MFNLEENVKSRCEWVTKDPLYITYHDTEWGKPQYDSKSLFVMLCLEGQQAGLSWLTILKKRDNYRKLFFNFDPYKISQINSADVAEICCDTGIVRHKGKVESIIQNAKCFINMESQGENFSDFIWEFVSNTPIVNTWKGKGEVPVQTAESIALSKALKKKGFKFIGSTICYAFMQACGLVDDHVENCFVRKYK